MSQQPGKIRFDGAYAFERRSLDSVWRQCAHRCRAADATIQVIDSYRDTSVLG